MNPRTINDFNREYIYKHWKQEIEESKKPKKGATVRSAVFYAALVVMVLLAFFYSGNRDPGKRFGPFAYNTVLTGSMQSVYPQGSLITSWAIAPDEALKSGLQNGTDIVFTKEDGTVVVHRIIEIFENYEDSGQRAFRTQGVDNPNPDTWITFEGNVVGRVIWHMPYLGSVLAMIAENVLWIILIVAVLAATITLWKIVFKKETPATIKR
ncbi:MAG TPA: signal peptidase I [Ruminococcaceae bacterium]|nr:signal peptidase I [Oscillospiraceae bacterium]